MMSDESRRLPLFPLNVVLFPGGTLPLHIFEPRYRAMTRACLDGDRRFGVVLIAEGTEVGEPAVPHLTGTVARIATANALVDGRFNLVTVGERRFTIQEAELHGDGYLMGRVVLRPEVIDREPAVVAALVASVQEALAAYIGRLDVEPEPILAEVAAITDPLLLAGVVGTLLRDANERKQRLLEVDSVPRRMQGMLHLVRREIAVLDTLARPTDTPLERGVISPN
jgi:Lon protease-like protein